MGGDEGREEKREERIGERIGERRGAWENPFLIGKFHGILWKLRKLCG
jgi:hypothetical protein